MSCPNLQKNLSTCNCTYDCEKKGKYYECVAYHRAHKELPACYFNSQKEKTYDRSIENYFKN